MRGRPSTQNRAFSLVELVVVIVIIGILAAMAIPRLSRGSAGAGSAAVSGNLAIVRNALSLYHSEHNGQFPSGTAANIVAQLTQFTDINGNTSATKTGAFIYGPYLVQVPPAPVGENAGSRTILVSADSPPTVVTTAGEGWAYNATTGEFIINTTKTDDTGKAYNTY
jgi:prepilin-type N-terminal cleavage/methylation domain-containing protein